MDESETPNETLAQRDQSPCLQCKENISQNKELKNALMAVQNTFSITSDKQRKDFNVFTCRVCDHVDLHRETMSEHLNLHFQSKEVTYCKKCQEQTNQLTLGFYDEIQEPSVPYSTILNQRKGLVQYSTKHAGSAIPHCSFCSRSFGYLVPVLNRMSRRLQKRGYECTICGETRSHSRGMLKHAQNHVEDNVLFCWSCINNYRIEQEFYFPSSGSELDKKVITPPIEEPNEKTRPTANEYQQFKEELSKITKELPPFPIPLSSSESSDEAPMPEPYGRHHKYKKKARSRKEKLRKRGFTASKKTNVLSFSLGRELACFAGCLPRGTQSPDYTEASSRQSIFTCQSCRRELGGWSYARTSIFKRESITDVERNVIGQFSCQICTYTSEDWAPMENHILSHLEKKEIYCMNCLKNVKTK